MANFTSPAAACSSSQPTRAVRHARLNPDQNQLNRPGTGAIRPGRMVQPAMHQAGVRNNATAKRRLLAHSLVAAVMGMILCIPASVIAQEVYFSISGRSTTITSGDRTNQYDYWFRPAEGVQNPRPATVEVFDAGLGGFADVLQGQPSTVTTFQLYPFDSLYELDRRAITPSESAATALESVSAAAEDRFLNRWVPFFQLGESGSVNGFIVRVRTDDGNDVNDFKLRITGPGAEDWELITLNLAVGLYQSGPNNRFQFRPLWSDSPPPLLRVDGQEDSQVYLMDAFGETHPLFEQWTDFQLNRYGKPNSWAVEMTGSSMRVNNRVLMGVNEIVPFVYDPIILNETTAGTPDITQVPGDECLVYGLEAGYRGFSLNVNEAQWEIDDTRYTGASFRHTFSDYGRYAYQVLVPTWGRHVPEFVAASGELLVNTPPFAQVNNYRPIVAPGERITLDASMSYDPEGRDLRYQWFVNDDLRGNTPTFTFSTSVSGRFNVRLVLSDNESNASCTQTVEFLPIVVNTQPYAEIRYESVVARGVESPVTVINALDADGDELTFTWEGSGVQEPASGTETTVRHTEPGSYSLMLRVNDNSGTDNAEYTTEVRYKINAAPVPAFDLPTYLAPEQSLTLDAGASSDPDGDELAYSWELSDGRQLSGPVQEVSFSTPGTYTITLTANDGEQVDNSVQTLAREVIVNAAPEPRIAATDFTNNPIVTFDASGSTDADQQIEAYEWDFGDGNTSTGSVPTHTYTRHGTYTVTLTVDDGTNVPNSRQSTTHQIRVNKNPVAQATAPAIVAPGQPIALDASASTDPDGDPLRFSWSHNGTEIGSDARTEYTINQPGQHNLNVTVRDDTPFEDASDNASVTVRVNHAPVIAYQMDPVVTAPGQTTIFDATSTYDTDNENLDIRWEFSDGISLDGASVQREFGEPGEVYFTIIADDGEGLSNSVTTQTGSIRVNQEPVLVTETRIRSNDMTVLLDASESYDPDGDNLRYTWTLPDGQTRTGSAFRWTAPEPGVHAISLRIDDTEDLSNSRVTERIEILINRAPVAVVDEVIESCTDQVIIFSGARSFDPDGDSFQTLWDFGDGNTSNEPNPVHSYADPGRYTASITLDDGFNETPARRQIPVIIEGSPQARIQGSEFTVCANSPITFDGSGSTDPNGMIGSYSWDFGDMNSAVGEKTTHLFTRPGTYRVTLTITGSGTGNCPNISQATALVTVVAAPMAQFEVPSVVAPGQTITLDGSQSESEDTITSTRWTVRKDGEEVATLTGMRNTYTPQEPGRYEIELVINTDNQAGCSLNSLTRVVRVNAAPQLSWNLPDQHPRHRPFRLSAEGSADPDGYIGRFTWLFNGEEIGEGLTVPMPVGEFGTHRVELIARDDAGVGNSEVRLSGEVLVSPAPEPEFTLPDVVYAGEEVTVQAADVADRAGNAVVSAWVVNGGELAGDDARVEDGGRSLRFTARGARYDITLSQDNGLGLSNSVASVRRVLNVRGVPVPRVALPQVVVAGTAISAEELSLPDGFVLLDSGGWGAGQVFTPGEALVGEGLPAGLTCASVWVAGEADGSNAGDETARLFVGWQPRGEDTPVLAVYGFEVPMLPALQANADRIDVSATYNPVNSTVLVRAPQLNRPADAAVTFTWQRSGSGETLARGSSAQLPVRQGVNTFELIIRDNDRVTGRDDLILPVTVTVE